MRSPLLEMGVTPKRPVSCMDGPLRICSGEKRSAGAAGGGDVVAQPAPSDRSATSVASRRMPGILARPEGVPSFSNTALKRLR